MSFGKSLTKFNLAFKCWIDCLFLFQGYLICVLLKAFDLAAIIDALLGVYVLEAIFAVRLKVCYVVFGVFDLAAMMDF